MQKRPAQCPLQIGKIEISRKVNAPLFLEVSWKIDDGFQTVTKTFYPPFTRVDREEDYRRAWEVYEERYKDTN